MTTLETGTATTATTVLEIDRLTVRYGKTTALDAATFSVRAGSVHALLGRNGAGKSSLVRCVLGQQRATSGRVTLFGLDSWRQRARAMLRVGVVPEEPDAPPDMTAPAIAAFLARLYPRWDGVGVARRLERFGVPGDVPFVRLSKGQKCQVMLGLALGHAPDLLVLDDPTLGLDVVARNAVFEELVGELADRGSTVFITSHDLAGVERIADHVGILVEGRLVLDEDLETLKTRFRLVRYRPAAAPGAEACKELAVFDVVRSESGPLGVSAVVSNFNDERFARFVALPGVLDPKPSSLSLEEIFTALTAPKGARS